ncbi:hypothetical protein [Marinobacter lutaoensis]|jgi:hypothetical protein|uniref:hypothetical protein n=1 Tax=Marinobacter lutaoensis TaxID=135739 RepID=UPI00158CAE6B|nr:hypothetical protein [Marinobacter lutaoensis]NVD34242.1 hypothetical protein [Marinobacter lutaoensis]|tara:strand:+ start:1710 stop:1880 length:171 start_codon:yes stop_codon:yes gene_type:complete
MPDEQYKKLHPILNEVTQTYIDLYTNRPNEKTREQLIKLENLLHEKLEALRKARQE